MLDLSSVSSSNVATWLAALAFFIGGAANALGSKTIRGDFVRYGFPSWWCWVTAALEFMTAALLLIPATFYEGVLLGAVIMVAAIASVIRVRNFRHLPPPVVFLLLLILAGLFHS